MAPMAQPDNMKPELRKARSMPSERRVSRRKPSMEFTASLQAQAVAARANYQATVRGKVESPGPSAQTMRVVDEASDGVSSTSAPSPRVNRHETASVDPCATPLVRTRSRSLAPGYARWDPYSERVADWNLLQSDRPITTGSRQHVPPPLNISRKSSVQSENPVGSQSTTVRRSVQQSKRTPEISKPRTLVEPDIKPPIPRRSSKRLQAQPQSLRMQRYSLGQALGFSPPSALAPERDEERSRHDSVIDYPDTGRIGSGDRSNRSIRLTPPSPASRDRSRSPIHSFTSSQAIECGQQNHRLPDFTHEVHHYHIFSPVVPVLDLEFPSPPRAGPLEECDHDDGADDMRHELSNHMSDVVKRFLEKAKLKTNIRYEGLGLQKKSSSASLPSEKRRERGDPSPERTKYKTAPWWVQRASPTSEKMGRSTNSFIPEFAFDLGDLMPEELQPQVHRSNTVGKLIC